MESSRGWFELRTAEVGFPTTRPNGTKLGASDDVSWVVGDVSCVVDDDMSWDIDAFARIRQMSTANPGLAILRAETDEPYNL